MVGPIDRNEGSHQFKKLEAPKEKQVPRPMRVDSKGKKPSSVIKVEGSTKESKFFLRFMQ